MNIDIAHKHSGHVIEINGHPFKANEKGEWDLTEISQTLQLNRRKSPSEWRTKAAKRLTLTQKMRVEKMGFQFRTLATKRAALAYAAWVSAEFEEMVFDAFEAILENPEVAQAVAKAMSLSGHQHTAALMERMLTENQERNRILREINRSNRRPLTEAQKERRKLARMESAEIQKARKAGREFY